MLIPYAYYAVSVLYLVVIVSVSKLMCFGGCIYANSCYEIASYYSGV